jgi:hypothetical protein
MFPGVSPDLSREPDPVCLFCAFGKAHCTSHKSHVGHISQDHTKTGEGVSSDGLESSTPGCPFTTKGSELKLRYNYISFWVDHASTFVYITFHASKVATELVCSKIEFEEYGSQLNVRIRNIRADNGVYSAQAFRDACMKKQQPLTFWCCQRPSTKWDLNVLLAQSHNKLALYYSMQWQNSPT